MIDKKIESRFHLLNRFDWKKLRAGTPLCLTESELIQLRGTEVQVTLSEVEDIYLPLSRLLNLNVLASIELYKSTFEFLATPSIRVPYVIGLAGSVAAGKTTMAKIMQVLLSRWDSHPKVALISTDGFLYSNKVLEERGLMERKGFPESYDTKELIRFLSDIKSGREVVKAPVYSHLIYDIVPNEFEYIRSPDILIVEGLNVLQTATKSKNIIFASDFFDYAIYLDADPQFLKDWFVERFIQATHSVFRSPESYFHNYSDISEGQARSEALSFWQRINEKNLFTNILPTRYRADLILRKGSGHYVESIALRKL